MNNFQIKNKKAFFSTALINSPYCNKLIDDNLFFLNFNDKSYRKAQNRKSIDWVGFSPSFLEDVDIERLKVI